MYILLYTHIIHTYTDEGMQFRNIFVWKIYVIFDASQRSHILKLFFMYVYI